MNALQSGIDAKSAVILHEKAAHLEALRDDYYREYRPTAPAQRALVDILIDSEWLLRRFRRVEAEMWEWEINNLYNPDEGVEAGLAFMRKADVFTRLQRRIDATERNFYKALAQLQKLQAAEPETAAEPEAEPTQIKPLTSEIGFVPQIIAPAPITSLDTPPPVPIKI